MGYRRIVRLAAAVALYATMTASSAFASDCCLTQPTIAWTSLPRLIEIVRAFAIGNGQNMDQVAMMGLRDASNGEAFLLDAGRNIRVMDHNQYIATISVAGQRLYTLTASIKCK